MRGWVARALACVQLTCGAMLRRCAKASELLNNHTLPGADAAFSRACKAGVTMGARRS